MEKESTMRYQNRNPTMVVTAMVVKATFTIFSSMYICNADQQELLLQSSSSFLLLFLKDLED